MGAAHVFQGIYRPKTLNLRQEQNIFNHKINCLRDEMATTKVSAAYGLQLPTATFVYVRAASSSSGTGSASVSAPIGLLSRSDMATLVVPYMKQLHSLLLSTPAAVSTHTHTHRPSNTTATATTATTDGTATAMSIFSLTCPRDSLEAISS